MEEGVQNRQKTRQRQDLDLELGVAGFTLGKGVLLVKGWALPDYQESPLCTQETFLGSCLAWRNPGPLNMHTNQHSLYWEKNQFPVSSSGSQPKPRVTPLYISTSLFSNSQSTSVQG